VVEQEVPLFDRAQQRLFANGGFSAAESWHIHRDMLSTEKKDQYDPRVASRIAAGEAMRAADYVQLLRERDEICAEVATLMRGFDAFVYPTTAAIAPTIAEASASDEAYVALNLKLLRNPGLVNAIDGCAASVPCHPEGTPPVGFSVAGTRGTDSHVLAVAQTVEALLSGGDEAPAAKKARTS